MKTLRLLLGDQLNIKHPWFKETNDDVIYCLFEMRQETDYVLHHIQKVIGFFAAMRQFAEDIKTKGHNVVYYMINDKENTQELTKNLNQLIQKHNIQHFEYQYPDEYRLDKQLKDFCKELDIESRVISSHHFYTERDDVKNFFEGKKQYLMETFYRDMRINHDILMQNGQPEGGKWNYDKNNRNKWNGDVTIPAYKYFKNNVDEVVKDIEKAKIKTFGNFATKTFAYPITRKQSLEQLKFFCEELLQHFGDYQDAMHTDEAYLFHSRLSFAMNLKLISPKDVVKTVENYYSSHHKSVDISQVEGFIRQIIGWREYMRGMYWALMPKFKKDNALKHKNKLASFYWDADTKMNCLKHSIQNSLDNGYAHHIQRLMITGNYALLTQTDPDEVDDWYLGIYVDAVEWVQLPNTRGMSQFADGGKIATKPYVSSGSYINKMSNYCGSCYYSKTKKTGDKACPFNSLYWNFLDDHRKTLSDNHRMTMMYSLLDKMKPKDLEALKEKAQHIIEHQSSY
ncbi:cryptochrome/photolyase family protein [Subsaxibacter sp. CAU 1640]|uniref:cryptochrome/photolyase family protein n=1 Tax=Subsaxibacter sp. CAU 1640 TaxID=2933271 RepID=UPI0020037AF6|nr:cryptochrome/photolyase family protein [Subsaxibacter sp. CAU 1640]MCK7591254.1 cryptochrome/photolyase family protein [Subsaxibacter sp. CAU 1640]